MRNIIHKIFTILLFFSLISCSKEPPIFVPGEGGNGDGGDSSESITQADYNIITSRNHPRILMTQDECNLLKEKLGKNDDPVLEKLHNGIMMVANSNNVLNGSTLEYKLDASGRRILNQAKDATRRILYLSYAYRITGDLKYSKAAEKVMNDVCHFPDWNARRHFLDAAEMCMAVSIGYDWLYDVISTETKTLAEKCIKDFAFYPAQNKIWNLNFYEHTDNWNSACNSGLICGALAIFEKDSKQAKEIIEAAVESVPKAVKGMFYPSGAYEEGYSYWRASSIQNGLIFTNLQENIGTDFGMSQSKGWKETSLCQLFLVGTSNQAFAYSDSDYFVGAAVGQWYFAYAFNNPSSLYNEINILNSGTYFNSDNLDVTRMIPFAVVYYNKMKDVNLSTIDKPNKRMFYGKDPDKKGVDLCLIRTGWDNVENDFYLGVKGGKASSSHAHMDSGSFVYDAFGVRWSYDLGLQSYTSVENALKSQGGNLWDMSQNSLRWDVMRLNNRYHSTLTINGKKHNVDGYGTLVNSFDDATGIGCTIDLSEVFGDDVRKCIRTFRISGDELHITDEIQAPKNARVTLDWRMVTKATATQTKDYISLQSGSKKMYLKSKSSGPKMEYTIWDASPEHSYDAPNPGVSVVGFKGTVTTGQTVKFETVLTPHN